MKRTNKHNHVYTKHSLLIEEAQNVLRSIPSTQLTDCFVGNDEEGYLFFDKPFIVWCPDYDIFTETEPKRLTDLPLHERVRLTPLICQLLDVAIEKEPHFVEEVLEATNELEHKLAELG